MKSALKSPGSASRGPDYSRVHALVVDENAAARMAVKSLLQSIGVDKVQQAADPIRAIRLMELDQFDLVLCEARFQSQMDGCQVLEYVRTRRLLQPGAAFVLLSGDADRSLVAAAREWQPDGFVLKPLTAGSLVPRIEQALRLRRLRAPLYEAADRDDAQAVLTHARRLAQEAGAPSLELLRWQAQALIDLGRFAQAREVCTKAQDIKRDVPWVEVALGHCERADNKLEAACERMRATIRAYPFLGGAYDLLIELLQEQGQTARALVVARSALEQLATSQRMRTLGEIAYAHGDFETAEQSYTDLIRKTSTSLTRSPLDIGMLGQVYVTQGNAEKALRLIQTVQDSADPPSQALAASVTAQALSAKGDAPAAEMAARKALRMAGLAPAPEGVAMLVAQGAFAAGLNDEAQALVMRTMKARKRQASPGALARKVLTEAGMDPEAFVSPWQAAVVAAAAAPAPPEATLPASAPTAAMPAAGTASEDVTRALECLHHARFDEAVAHVDRARARLPANPMVLMASVQVHLMRMRATGFDAGSARTVRRCLVEIDRQVPGDERVFQFAGG
jgi:DNA-binding NarL/FixJ family response regulator/tetratricopeptide (TPR) repeat protein